MQPNINQKSPSIQRFSQENVLSAMGRVYENRDARERLVYQFMPNTKNARTFNATIGFLTIEVPTEWWTRDGNETLEKYISPAISGGLPSAIPEEGLYPYFLYEQDMRDFTDFWVKEKQKFTKEVERVAAAKKKLDPQAMALKVSYYYIIFTSGFTGKNYLVVTRNQTQIRQDFRSLKDAIDGMFAPIDARLAVGAPAQNGNRTPIETSVMAIDERLEQYKNGYVDKMRSLPFFSLERFSMYLIKNFVFKNVESRAQQEKQRAIANAARPATNQPMTLQDFTKTFNERVLAFADMPKKAQKSFQIGNSVTVRYLSAGEE